MKARLLTLLGVLACGQPSVLGPPDSSDRLGVWVPDGSATLLRTGHSGLEDPLLTVVSTRASWQTVWAQAWSGATAAPLLPAVDFVLASVVVVGLGRRTGDHTVTIDSIVTKISGAVLYGTAETLDSRCQAAVGHSTPVHMVLSPGHPPIVDWQLGHQVRSCAP